MVRKRGKGRRYYIKRAKIRRTQTEYIWDKFMRHFHKLAADAPPPTATVTLANGDEVSIESMKVDHIVTHPDGRVDVHFTFQPVLDYFKFNIEVS